METFTEYADKYICEEYRAGFLEFIRPDSVREGLSESRVISVQDMVVLVIDDDQVACEHAKLVLGQVGIGCDTALSGAEGLEMVKLRHARREPYNLILVDWKMPEMDGLEATRHIRESGREDAKSIPIIALAANAFDEDVQRSLQAGLNAHLSKPVEPDPLFETLEMFIKK